MYAVKLDTQARRSENARADRADQKSGTGIVAERQQVFALPYADSAILYQFREIGGAHRITARQPDEERRHAFPGAAEYPRGGRGQGFSQQAWKAESAQQDRDDKERKQDYGFSDA